MKTIYKKFTSFSFALLRRRICLLKMLSFVLLLTLIVEYDIIFTDEIVKEGEEMLSILAMVIDNPEDYSLIETLYNRYEKFMYVIAYSILRNRSDAEDCVHDVVLTIVDHLDKFKSADDENKLKNLVAIITRNKAKDIYRRRKKQMDIEVLNAVENGNNPSLSFAPSEDDILRMIADYEARRYVASLIQQLDNKYRDIILLKFEQGMSNKDIASVLGISEDLVRTRYMRAKKILLERGGKKLYDASRK